MARPRDAALAAEVPAPGPGRRWARPAAPPPSPSARDGGRPVVTSQRMEIRGDAKQLLNSVLPHEVTHTVLAHHFGRPVPRWADEGGSVLSENDEERFSHDVRCREILNAGRGIRPPHAVPHDRVPARHDRAVRPGLLDDRVPGGEGRRRPRGPRRSCSSSSASGMTRATRRRAGTRRPARCTGSSRWTGWRRRGSTRCGRRRRGPRPASTATRRSRPPSPTFTGTATGGNRTELRSSAAPSMPLLEPPVRAARGAAPDVEPTRPTHLPTVAPTKPAVAERPPPVLLPPEIPRTSRP